MRGACSTELKMLASVDFAPIADVTGTEIVVDGGGIQMPMLGGQVRAPLPRVPLLLLPGWLSLHFIYVVHAGPPSLLHLALTYICLWLAPHGACSA